MSLMIYAQNGGPASFGQVPGPNMFASDAAQQPDGKIVVVGNTNGDWFIWRFNVDGSIDTSFNLTGRRTIGFGENNNDQVNNVAVQPDGRILVSGFTNGDSGAVTFVMRLNPDGSNDNSFGPYANGILIVFDNSIFSQKMVLRPNGKILLMNMNFSNPPFFNETTTTFYQLNNDGSPDSGFGDGGILYAFEPRQNTLVDAEVQADNKLVVLTTRDYVQDGMVEIHDQEIELTRYNTNGSLDAAFGENGKSIVNTSPPSIGPGAYDTNGLEAARGLVIDSSGKIGVAAMSLQVAPSQGPPAGTGYPGRLKEVCRLRITVRHERAAGWTKFFETIQIQRDSRHLYAARDQRHLRAARQGTGYLRVLPRIHLLSLAELPDFRHLGHAREIFVHLGGQQRQ